MGCKKNSKEEDEWRRGGVDCGRIRREKSKNGGSSGSGSREGGRWMASGGGADWGRIRREKSKNERCCNAVGARGQWMENTDAPGVRGKPGESRASGRGRDSPDAHLFFCWCRYTGSLLWLPYPILNLPHISLLLHHLSLPYPRAILIYRAHPPVYQSTRICFLSLPVPFFPTPMYPNPFASPHQFLRPCFACSVSPPGFAHNLLYILCTGSLPVDSPRHDPDCPSSASALYWFLCSCLAANQHFPGPCSVHPFSTSFAQPWLWGPWDSLGSAITILLPQIRVVLNLVIASPHLAVLEMIYYQYKQILIANDNPSSRANTKSLVSVAVLTINAK